MPKAVAARPASIADAEDLRERIKSPHQFREHWFLRPSTNPLDGEELEGEDAAGGPPPGKGVLPSSDPPAAPVVKQSVILTNLDSRQQDPPLGLFGDEVPGLEDMPSTPMGSGVEGAGGPPRRMR